MARLQPLGIPFHGSFASLLPQAGDLQYTSGFVAPFDRYRQAVHTFDALHGGKRLRPIGVRYTFLSGTKHASLHALRDVVRSVRGKRVCPLWLSEYAARVRGFDRATIARRLDGRWEVAGLEDLRTLRIDPSAGWPDLARSTQVAGATDSPQGRYLHLVGPRAAVALGPSVPDQPYLAHANATVVAWAATREGARVSLHGHLPIEIVVGRCPSPRLAAGGRTFLGRKDGDGAWFALPWSEVHDAALVCTR